jgi:hypothetical protein
VSAADYADERCAPSATLLAAWTVQAEAGRPVSVRGECPHCAHPSQVDIPTVIVSAGIVAGEQQAPPPATTLTRQVHCACTEAHQRPAGITAGCGRWWLATLVRRPDASWVMTPAADDSLLSTAQALDVALAHQRDDVTAAAQKWLAGVTALYGIFGLTGVAVGKDALSGLASWVTVLVGLAVLSGVVAAAAATIWAYQAAYGWPRIDALADDDQQRAWKVRHDAYSATAATALRRAVLAAGGALGALLLATGLIWFGARATPPAPVVTVTGLDASSTCGTLLSSDSGSSIRVRREDGSVVTRIPSEVARVTVGPCPS